MEYGGFRQSVVELRGRFVRPRVIATAALVAALLCLVFVWTPSYWVSVVAALALPFLLRRHCEVLVVFAALAAQEAVPLPLVGPMTSFGSQAFYAGKVPLEMILALTAAVLIALRLRAQGSLNLTRIAWVATALIAGLALVMIVAGLIDGQSLFSAINQNARPCFVVFAGVVVGLGLRTASRDELRRTAWVTAAMMIALALAAFVVAIMNRPADSRVSQFYIYADSALPALAVAIVFALVLTRRRWDWRSAVVVTACMVIVVFSFRRGVWLSATFPLVAIFLLFGGRLRSARRLAIVLAATVAFVAAVPGLGADVSTRLVGGAPRHVQVGVTDDEYDQSSGGVAENSAEGHMKDLKVGWHLVQDHFWTGLGPRAPQQDGLAARLSQRVYVHNEWLLDWLRYGPVAALFVTAFALVFMWLAITSLRRRGSPMLERTAALFALSTPPNLMLFPFLTTTVRWPLLIGMAIGVLGLARVDQAAGSGRHRQAEEPSVATIETAGR
jgi:O-antigen ligase